MAEHPEPGEPDELDPSEVDDEAEDSTSESEEAPTSPFTTETVHFMAGLDSELFAVVVEGEQVKAQTISLELAGDLLRRMGQLVLSLAGAVAGKESGKRGPLKMPDGVHGLALAGIAWGNSVTFHFALASDEQMQLSAPDNVFSPTSEGVKIAIELVERAASGDAERLYEATRDLPTRVSVNFTQLLDVLTKNDVDTKWQMREEGSAIVLTAENAAEARSWMTREAVTSTHTYTVTGLLYEAHSRRRGSRPRGFEILVEDGYPEPELKGTYPADLRDLVRNAWDRRARVKVRVTERFLARQDERPASVDAELLDLLEILPEE